MTIQEFQAFAGTKDLKVSGKGAYGLAGGFPIAVSLRNKMIQVVFTVRQGEFSQIRKTLKTNLKQIATYQILGAEHFYILIDGRTEQQLEKYDRAIQGVLDAFSVFSIRPVDTCPICKSAGCDSYAHMGNGYQPLHKRCITGIYEQEKNNAEKNSLGGNYFLGLIGGIIGGLIASIPCFLTIWFMERAYSLLYALIPLGVYYGYKLLKGKLNKAAVAITIVLSVILAVGIDFVTLAVAFAAEGLPVGLIWYVLQDAEIRGQMLSENIISLIFVGLGIWITWRQITRTPDSSVADIEESMATLTTVSPEMTDPVLNEAVVTDDLLQ
ncbi:hypothetical protein [Anaerolentibacter hominis]|uniref:hypothetical protein n=1 Tax=Anaerolentibacter hominis TaxID=3079009 RepID=UPI0031B843FA